MSRDTEVFGTWINALGTIFEAVGSTQRFNLSQTSRDSLEIIGVTMQAGGDALVANEADEIQEKTGGSISSIGNVTILYGLLNDVPDEKQNVLSIKGNLLQALGGSIPLVESYPLGDGKEEIFSLYGTMIEITGNLIQALAAQRELKGEDGERLDTLGAWVQALGAVISALGLELEIAAEGENERENSNKYNK